jgi:N-acetylmuramoyl-L-alanine amidase
VRLTRDTDVYVEHEDRVTLARNWGAELFISLHADAAGSASVSGASVYTISARGETRIDREATKNDWKIVMEDGTPDRLNGLLEDLVKRETKTRSAEFAELLLPELSKAGPVLRNTHRNAGFYVLLAPDVPAVLLELGFLTNEADAKRLQSERGRRASVEAIAAAIDDYFDQQDLRLASN